MVTTKSSWLIVWLESSSGWTVITDLQNLRFEVRTAMFGGPGLSRPMRGGGERLKPVGPEMKPVWPDIKPDWPEMNLAGTTSRSSTIMSWAASSQPRDMFMSDILLQLRYVEVLGKVSLLFYFYFFLLIIHTVGVQPFSLSKLLGVWLVVGVPWG